MELETVRAAPKAARIEPFQRKVPVPKGPLVSGSSADTDVCSGSGRPGNKRRQNGIAAVGAFSRQTQAATVADTHP